MRTLSSAGPVTTLLIALVAAACGASTGAVRGNGDISEVAPEAPPPESESAPASETAAPLVPGVDLDTVRAGRFDSGKMWTFEYPPLDYLRESYGFAPDSAWFARARLGALRLPNCSASFVSPNGLVMTNHHCAREGVADVTRPGERLLDNGFYARSLEEERLWEETHADQLIAIHDVSDEVLAADPDMRDATLEAIRRRIAEEYGGEDAGIVVETIALWNGGRYSAYVFRRYGNVRLVFAPELKLGQFGGDPDNFTYPRYSLDVSFLRVYDDAGNPLKPEYHFRWSERGVQEDDAVFVVGNPGSTSRLQTVAQLEYRRDVGNKAIVSLLESRVAAYRAYYDEGAEPDELDEIRNTMLELSNAAKAYRGQWEGLYDPVTMARRRHWERSFRAAIEADPDLSAQYADLFDRMAEIQKRKAELAADYGAFLALGSSSLSAAVFMRGFWGLQYVTMRERGAQPQTLAGIEERLRSVADQPNGLQRRLLTARLEDFARYYGEDSDIAGRILQGRDPEEAAEVIIAGSVLADSASAAAALADGSLTMDDPALQVLAAVVPRFGLYRSQFNQLAQQEGEITGQLGRAFFEVYGTSTPPDATFSLRIADGVVKGYEYNGTYAPIYTTFYGLYDHYYSYGAGSDWDLPERWLRPPESFDLSTPLNFVMTADVIGGNSGSPVLNKDLEVVGVIFDGNIESLPGDYIYYPKVNRAVAVDVRAILEALDDMYDADRIVLELTSGKLARTEAEADAIRARVVVR